MNRKSPGGCRYSPLRAIRPYIELVIQGFDDDQWWAAKAELRRLLIDTAKSKSVVAYSEAVAQLDAIQFEPNDPRFHRMLDELSTDEDEADRGLITVLVVHKSGDYRPGPGFFELAASRGRAVDDIDKTWLAELRSVWDYWLQN
jgi:hypothetical protein